MSAPSAIQAATMARSGAETLALGAGGMYGGEGGVAVGSPDMMK